MDAPTSTHPGPPCCVSVDVEEYFQIEAAYRTVPRGDWGRWPSRVERNVELLLALFDRHKRRGTFFILGYIAQKHPGLVRRIAAAGHEVASHGTGHDRLHRLTAEAFREDLRTSKKALEECIGRAIIGYRAPTFSIMPETAWAIDVLVEEGFLYDSSIFPVRHPWYGVPSAPDRPFWVRGREGGAKILEVPPLTWSVAGRNVAVAGGGYFRLLPLWFMKRGLAQAAASGRPAVLYFHPWEFDPGMPRMKLPVMGRIRTYTGLAGAERRLGNILAREGRWLPVGEMLEELREMADGQEVFSLHRAGSVSAKPQATG